MSETDWKIGLQFKNKPGSQGTLFSGGTKFSSPARFPRGYTPGRQKEVMDALNVNPHDYSVGGAPMPAGGQGIRPARRRLIDTIARSTVPPEHLQGAQFYPGQFGMGDTGGTYKHNNVRNQALSGSMSDSPKPLGDVPKHLQAKISIAQGHEGGRFVIHEIGHHASMLNGTNAYSTPAEMGTEEGRADSYAYKHFRDKQGRQLAGIPLYHPLKGQVPDDGGRSVNEFGDNYLRERRENGGAFSTFVSHSERRLYEAAKQEDSDRSAQADQRTLF